MFKKTVLLVAAICSFTAFANDLETANELYANRTYKGDRDSNAGEAHKIYLNLARTRATSAQEKANLLTHASKALFFDAMIMPDSSKQEKMQRFWDAFELGLEACNIMATGPCDQKNPVTVKEGFSKEALSLAMYWAGANAARWGKLKGPFSALSKWRNILEPRIKDMMDLAPNVYNYGMHRIAGGALNVLGGDIRGRDALSFMQEAFDATSHDVDGIVTANDMATNTFYLDALRKAGDVERFCEIYDMIVEVKEIGAEDPEFLEAAFPGMVADYYWVVENEFDPETKFHKYYSRKCE